MTTLLCIPAFNEEHLIGDVVKNSLKFVDHVVVCDDGSNDRTSENAENAGAYVIQHTHNKGKGAALQSLFKYAKHHNSEIIVTMDGDGQFIPDEIPLLCKPISDGNSDVVIGYRFENNDEMPKYREIGNKMLDRISKLSTNLSLRDTQSGFRAYSKKTIQIIKFSNDGFGADSEILINAFDNNLKISEVKVTVIYNTGYKTSTKNPISHTSSVAASLIESVLIRHPLKFLGLPGLILIIIGIITSSYVLSVFNDYSYFSIPFTLISLGLLLFGLLLILFSGLLFSFNRQLRKI
jgi:glycosyltransferase involved in cell wall biosynthesis